MKRLSYDNSELLRNYVHGFQALGLPLYRATAEDIISWVGEVLSDPQRGGFDASQDADQTLDDDGDYFTWTLAELRAVLTPEEASVMELYYHVGEVGQMHHNHAKNVLWIAESPAAIAQKQKLSEVQVTQTIARAKTRMLAARRLRQPTPTIDTTLYVAWNAMFVSAYLEAARILGREDCRAFARKTLDLLLAEAWDDSRGFSHRAGGPLLEGSLDDQVFGAAALLDAYEDTLDSRYFAAAERTMHVAVGRFGDPDNGGFFDRPRDTAPMGGLAVRRKPLQDSPTPGANSAAAIVLDRLYALTGERLYHEWAEKTLGSLRRSRSRSTDSLPRPTVSPRCFARHPLQVVVTGAADDPRAAALEEAAHQSLSLRKISFARHSRTPWLGQFAGGAPRDPAPRERRQPAGFCLRRNYVLPGGLRFRRAQISPGSGGDCCRRGCRSGKNMSAELLVTDCADQDVHGAKQRWALSLPSVCECVKMSSPRWKMNPNL